MVLDTTVMNVSIANVVNDLHASVTQIQSAITAFTLVMAASMITGGKLGDILGRRRALRIGVVVYGLGSLVTALSKNIVMLLIGWSVLEGLGAALILPAITALIAANFEGQARAKAYGTMAAVTAASVATGPIIGGFATTNFSWRWVFAAESVASLGILFGCRVVADAESTAERTGFDVVGSLLSALGLGLAVFGVLQAGAWGLFAPSTAGSPRLLGVSAAFWLIVVGGLVIAGFLAWVGRATELGRPALINRSLLSRPQLSTGLQVILAQNLVQAGVFFVVPVFLTVVLGLSAMSTGLAVMPMSITLVIGALAAPRVAPNASPRSIVLIGLVMMLGAIVALLANITSSATATSFRLALLLMGLGVGLLASQLGNVIVSSVPVEASSEVGGLQYTAQNLGQSLGTAIVGALLVAGLASSLRTGVLDDPALRDSVKQQASVRIDAGVSMVSDDDLRAALAKTTLTPQEQEQIIEVNREARLRALRQAVAVVGLLIVLAFAVARKLPRTSLVAAATDTAAAGAP